MLAKSIVIFLSFCIYLPCLAQEVIHNVQPTMYVHYQASINQSDTLVKYFFTSNQSTYGTGKFAFMAEFNLKNEQITVDTIVDSSGHRLLGTSYELYALQASDSTVVLATNNFDCDLPYSQLACLDFHGEVKWYLEYFDYFFEEVDVKALGMINQNIIAVDKEIQPTSFFDLAGNDVIIDIPPDIYFNTLQIGSNWYGTRDHWLYKLDNNFNVVDTYLSDSIRYISETSNSRIIIGSNSDLIIVDTLFNEIAEAEIISKAADGFDSNVWVLTSEGLYLLDSLLKVNKFFPSIANEKMQTVNAYLDEAFVLSDYDGIQHKDFVIRKYSGKDTIAPVSLDLAIESVQLPEEIIRELWNGFPYAFTLYFDSISFTLRNNSTDPIESCIINYDWRSDAWCVSSHAEWHFDSINIMPNQTEVLTVYSYLTEIIFSSVYSPLCFWVDHPNRMPDVEPSNNFSCDHANFISATPNVTESTIKLFPNPASENIYFENDGPDFQPLIVSIYDITGVMLKSFNLNSFPSELSVSEMPSGIYFIKLTDQENRVDTRKLVISH